MRVVIHLGLPKTGTTSIQRFLRQNASALSERGVAYERIPNPVVEPQDSQLEFGICQFARVGKVVPYDLTARAYGLIDVAAQADFARQYEEDFLRALEARTEDTYVISSEHIGAWTHKPEHVAALDDWMREIFDDVRYVQYIRRQEDWLLSRYSQELRSGSEAHLEKFIKKNGKHNFGVKADLWTGIVGHDRFSLRLMERDAMVNGDLIDDFASAVGFDPDGLSRPERENESLSPQAAFFLRRFNQRARVRDAGDDNGLQYQVERTLSEWSVGKPKLRLWPQQISWIRSANAEHNDLVRRKYFPNRAELFPAKPVESPDGAGFSDVDRDAIAAIGTDLLFRFANQTP
ncbi:hypothetical protein [Tropicimonas marinistellae]|uniref:hypothetical protein n=1 Tax=Tropicimonas marinistellae TaxID=1739787 RepID=UPI00082F8490|nr:hypothetical protein [Tropicimonas marinistellae]